MPPTSYSQSDISTVISLLPIAIREKKPGLTPSEFFIPAADKEFQTLVIKRCTFSVYLDEFRPPLVVPDPSDQVAQSIVFDFKVASLGYDPGVAEPGLFWVPGVCSTRDEMRKKFDTEFKEAERLQTGWFKKLVEHADDDWGRYRQHKFISSIQRFAANALKLEREWNLDRVVMEAAVRCPACGIQVGAEQVVCGQCRFVLRKDKYKPEDFAKA